MSTNKQANRLIHEKSPYLLQHAYNPVNWFPWNDEAFQKAKSEDKPIFLSIGYSTCHWCHVMERESFEDDEVAEVLNCDFICIKVDREERPDIDSIYMSVCQALTGHSGWPLTVFLTPEKEPFFAATYLPKHDSRGMVGIINLLGRVTNAWQKNKSSLIDTAHEIINSITTQPDEQAGDISINFITDAYSQLKYAFDKNYGGFGKSPKFPSPHNLLFLLRYWFMQKEDFALGIVEKTLEGMQLGGIYDHIGFGFSRYSTDQKWLVPHFEKMLYDNALLTLAYAECWQITQKPQFKDTADQILTYILRYMTSPEGGFYCAEDADSEGEEGKFYVWSKAEILDILGHEAGEDYSKLYGITSGGNFESKNIPNLIKNGLLTSEEQMFVAACRLKLYEHRETRIHPYKDDKVLTSWNGLMIAAMAYSGRIFNNAKYTEAAKKAVSFIYSKLIREDGRLLARYRDGEAAHLAYADDYAFLTWGLIELYNSTFELDYLKSAIALTENMLSLFWDESGGGFYHYGNDAEQLITRPKESYDGAVPSGNSVGAMNLLRLARITGRQDFENKANDIFKAFAISVESAPTGHTYMLSAFSYSISDKSSELILVAPSEESVFDDKDASLTNNQSVKARSITNIQMEDMLKNINSVYLPFTTTVSLKEKNESVVSLIPYLKEYVAKDGDISAYLCIDKSCMAPITRPDVLLDKLDNY